MVVLFRDTMYHRGTAKCTLGIMLYGITTFIIQPLSLSVHTLRQRERYGGVLENDWLSDCGTTLLRAVIITVIVLYVHIHLV